MKGVICDALPDRSVGSWCPLGNKHTRNVVYIGSWWSTPIQLRWASHCKNRRQTGKPRVERWWCDMPSSRGGGWSRAGWRPDSDPLRRKIPARYWTASGKTWWRKRQGIHTGTPWSAERKEYLSVGKACSFFPAHRIADLCRNSGCSRFCHLWKWRSTVEYRSTEVQATRREYWRSQGLDKVRTQSTDNHTNVFSVSWAYLHLNDRSRTFPGAFCTANTFVFIHNSKQAVGNGDRLHGTDFFAAAAGNALGLENNSFFSYSFHINSFL